MAIVVWPDGLPHFANRQGHTRSVGDGRLKSSTDVGPGKVRRQTSAANRPVSLAMLFNSWQLGRFERFWDDDTKGGSLPFQFPAIGRYGFPMRSPDGGRLLMPNGLPLLMRRWWLVRFSTTADVPSWQSQGPDLWQVAINLEILP